MTKQPEGLITLFAEIVHHARVGDYGAAASRLNSAVVLMQAELGSGTVSSAVLAQVTRYLDELFMAQKREDWIAFADTLEYAFIDFWHEHFTAPC
ncbi:MAG: hypothetical protein JW768_06050 [Chitinispirillaceae bacterium]|nr:hypothetical protein [Chitinispirillaceae bacterium]